jgi:hypothetical protein
VSKAPTGTAEFRSGSFSTVMTRRLRRQVHLHQRKGLLAWSALLPATVILNRTTSIALVPAHLACD